MTNILEAIKNIIQNPVTEIKNHYSVRNRMNNMGEALETYIKDAFANTIPISDPNQKITKYNETFSWLGNQNHPPDIIIKGGDAIEVKKTQSSNSGLALNSSYPKANLKADSPMITEECRTCEKWTEKDIIYCVGHTTDNTLKSLWIVYGNIYAAKHETYQIIKQKISNGINEIPNVEFAETNELGRVNKVDPLGITDLRIRGMWHIQNPRKVFNYIHQDTKNKFELIAIIPLEKYNAFPQKSKTNIENIQKETFTIKEIKIKDPNNPAKLINAKQITYIIK